MLCYHVKFITLTVIGLREDEKTEWIHQLKVQAGKGLKELFTSSTTPITVVLHITHNCAHRHTNVNTPQTSNLPFWLSLGSLRCSCRWWCSRDRRWTSHSLYSSCWGCLKENRRVLEPFRTELVDFMKSNISAAYKDILPPFFKASVIFVHRF